MQKKIIALAIAAAFAAPVSAMAAAELYGTVDAGYASTDVAGVKTTGMSSGTYASNNWGFKGSEDLGDGMKATFQFEGGFNTATGDGTANAVTGTAPANVANTPITGGSATNRIFDRGIAVGISAGWGDVVLGGNQYSTSFKTNKSWDPLGYKFISTTGMAGFATGANGRNDSDVAYTGKFGDVTVMAGRTLLSSTASANMGDASAVGVVYAAGDITAAVSYTATEAKDAVAATATAAASAAVVKSTNYSVGAAYSMGDAKVNVGYISNELDGAANATETKVVGASFKVSDKVGVAAAMYKQDTGSVENSNRKVLGATYALSKKTTMYAAYTTEKVADSKTTAVGLAVAF